MRVEPSPAILGGLSVLLAAASLAAREDRGLRTLAVGLSGAHEQPGRPRRGFLALVGRTRAARLVPTTALARALELAGSPTPVGDVVGLKILLGAGSFAMVLGPGRGVTSWIVGGLAGACAFFLPDLVLVRRGKRRQRRIELRVPDLVEVLVATAEAGLAPAVALERAAGVIHGPLGQEVGRVAAEIGLGVPWRVALNSLVERTEVPSLRRLAAALTRSSRLGSTVRSALRSVAADLRSTRRARAEELARRAPVKMLFPLVFLILPAFLLLTVGPVVLATLRSLQASG